MRRVNIVVCVLGVAWFAAAVAGKKEADAFFQAKDWASAARAYEEIAAHDAADAQAWYRLGVSRQFLKQYREAAAAYEKAEATGNAPRGTKYNLACSYSVMNRRDDAFRTLDQAIASGFANLATIDGDPDLENLRSDARYQQLRTKIEQTTRPCMSEPQARLFDFWIGDWDVSTSDGQKAGTSTIQSTDEGCILLEIWSGAGGDTGRSINYYDPTEGVWRQDWVSSRGAIIHYSGGFVDGAMRLAGEARLRNGMKQPARCTWTSLPDGRVRQLGEASDDGGRTWHVGYDLYYARKPK